MTGVLRCGVTASGGKEGWPPALALESFVGAKRGNSVFSFWRDDQHLDAIKDLAVGRLRVQLFKLLRHSRPAEGDIEQGLARVLISRADSGGDAITRTLTIISRAIGRAIIPDHLPSKWAHCAAQQVRQGSINVASGLFRPQINESGIFDPCVSASPNPAPTIRRESNPARWVTRLRRLSVDGVAEPMLILFT
jgi:hypothetical protein